MTFNHQLAGAGNQVGVIKQRSLCPEDRRIRGAKAALGVVLQRGELLAGTAECILQARAALAKRGRAIGNIGLRAGQYMHRTDGQPGAGADADDRCLRFGRIPAGDRRRLSLRCTLRIGLFLRDQPVHGLA